MRIYEVIQEAPSRYGQEGKPEWFDRAVALKKANPDITYADISRAVGGVKVGAGVANLAYWLTGQDRGTEPRIKRSGFPFKPSDFKRGYKQEDKPEWYDRAVQLKLDNPTMSAAELGRQIGVSRQPITYWLTGRNTSPGTSNYRERPHTKDWPPFKPEDFPVGGGPNSSPYGAGGKPKWYDQALQMAKAGKTFHAIGKELGVASSTISNWLVKGKKARGKLINPDAELEPRLIMPPKIDPQLKADVENLIKDPKLEDADIVELIADAYGTAEASKIKTILPTLRQKLNPGTQVIDKTRTGSMRDPDITGLIPEANNFTQARADAIAKGKALAGDYRSNNLADLGDILKQKQKADAKTQSWRDMKQTDDNAPTSKTTGTHTYKRGTTTAQQRRQYKKFDGIKSKPVGVAPDSSSSPLNTGVRELFNQGMSPSEIEDYLVFQKKIKRNLARKIIDQELYQPASTPPRRDNLGDIRNQSRDFHKRKLQQLKQQSDDNEEDK